MARFIFPRKDSFTIDDQKAKALIFTNPRLSDQQIAGARRIISVFNKHYPKTRRECVAYCLGTVYHETAFSMQPVREIGKGKGRKYGAPVGPYSKVYYGRGDVQVTWETNYKRADKLLAPYKVIPKGESLHSNPDLALDPTISAYLAVIGGMEGFYTGKGWFEIWETVEEIDWTDSRRVINGLDKADEIAAYAKTFLRCLV